MFVDIAPFTIRLNFMDLSLLFDVASGLKSLEAHWPHTKRRNLLNLRLLPTSFLDLSSALTNRFTSIKIQGNLLAAAGMFYWTGII